MNSSGTGDDIRRSREALAHAIREAGGEVNDNNTCRCPFHDDQSPSAGVKLLDKGHWHFHCFPCGWGGDVYAIIQRHRQCSFPDARDVAHGYAGSLPPEQTKKKPLTVYASPELAAGGYAKWKGGTVERLYRWTPSWVRARIVLPKGKTFLEITKAGDGWVQKAPPRPHPLYRVAELKPGPVAVHEGEKAVDASWSLGVQAVTSGGSNSATLANWQPLAGRIVAVFPDNDEPGRKYAREVCEVLTALTPACRCKVVNLPGLGDGDDLWDFLEEKRKS